MSQNISLDLQPKRTLKFWHIWALGVGAVVGDGIFLLMGQGIATAGPGSIVSYMVSGLLQLFLIIALIEMAIAMPNAGAMSTWVQRMMGKSWGFLAGFTFAIGWIIAGGSVGLALGKISVWFFPSLTAAWWPAFFAIFFVTLFAVINILGAVIAARVQLYMVLALVGVMVIFGIVGLKDVNLANFTPFLPYGAEGFFSAIPLGTYAYLGALTLVTAGAEAINPQRDLPRGLIWSSITFILLYSFAHFVLQGIIPWNEVTMDSSPFTVAAGQVFGVAGAFIMNLAAWIAAATCIIMGTIYATSRIFYSQAREGMLPKFLGVIHPKTYTPVNAIIVIWLATISLILIGQINPEFIYVELSNQLVIAWLFSWSLALIAGVLFRLKHKEEVAKLSWRQPLFPLFPVLGFIGIIVVLYGSFVGSLMTLVRGGIWLTILFLLFAVFNKSAFQGLKRPVKEKEAGEVSND
ncbi:amino acid permease [Planococcus sp. PAMC 21323]|uniref:APC family permease n=1 Tax=Planococcus sp. PAMC 21323 TaxID=1526927 RepID=UPI000585FCF6|nr:amino acid permease [Planococcus sp. PAMC 21323]AIY06817.1 amino acid permease [Planococcus sp. PAMC 21323]